MNDNHNKQTWKIAGKVSSIKIRKDHLKIIEIELSQLSSSEDEYLKPLKSDKAQINFRVDKNMNVFAELEEGVIADFIDDELEIELNDYLEITLEVDSGSGNILKISEIAKKNG